MPEIGICTKCGRRVSYADIEEETSEGNRLPPATGKTRMATPREITVLDEGNPKCKHHLIIKAEEDLMDNFSKKESRTVGDLSEREKDKVVRMKENGNSNKRIVREFSFRSEAPIYQIMKLKGKSLSQGKKENSAPPPDKSPEAEENPAPSTDGRIAIPEEALTIAMDTIIYLRSTYGMDDTEIRRIIYIMAAAFEEK